MCIKMNDDIEIKKGGIFFADLGEDNIVGSEQKGKRPVIVISNNVGNKFSPTIEVAVITSKLTKAKLPTHVELPMRYGLLQDSVILVEQVKTIDKQRLTGFIGNVDSALLNKLNAAIEIAFSVGDNVEIDKKTTIINDKIFKIHAYESTVITLKENGLLNEVTLNMLLEKRQHDLDVLIKFCELNHVNYMDFYKPYGYKESMAYN